MNRVLAMILAGGSGDRLSILSAERAKPAVPFGGKYRIIDFALSNCANSGVYKVGILTQYNPRSLAEHIGVGRPWDLDRGLLKGMMLLQPYLSRSGRDWYKGTADAIHQNLYFVEEQRIDEVLILAGDHVYIMRYDYMISSHRQRNADITIGVAEVPWEEAPRFGTVMLDHSERVVGFEEKVKQPKSNLASMGIYVFSKHALMECLEEDAHRENSTHDFGKDILPLALGKYQIYGYRFRGYWRDVGTVESYWQANMDLIVDLPQLNLYDPETTVRSVPLNASPAKIGPRAQISRSLICDGAIINGRVENSVISPGVYVEEGAYIKDSVIFSSTIISRDSFVHRAIIDKQVWVGPVCHIGWGEDYSPNAEEPNYLYTGITVVGKGAKVPPGTKIGRNCRIGCWVEKDDYPSDFIPSGASMDRKTPRRFRV